MCLAPAAVLLAGCYQQQAADGQPAAAPAAAPTQRAVTDWLFNLPGEEERLAQLQLQLRGLDVAMWETGYRYESIHEALGRQNYDLATYHWDKIKQTLDNALVRRPARRANSESLFLNTLFGEVRTALQTRNQEMAWAGFERARSACLSCHEAENVAYMNNMEMFELRAP
jgi:hypothetical protein